MDKMVSRANEFAMRSSNSDAFSVDLRTAITKTEIAATRNSVEIGDYVVAGTIGRADVFVGRVVAKYHHHFLVASLANEKIKSSYQYVDLIIPGGAKIVSKSEAYKAYNKSRRAAFKEYEEEYKAV